MSSPGFASTLDLRLAPSHRALRWIYALHLAPLTLIPFAMQAGYAQLVLAVIVGASWLWLRRHPAIGFGPRAITRLVRQPDGRWTLWRGARAAEAQLLPDTFVSRHLIVLNLRPLATGPAAPMPRRLSRVLLGDELPVEQLRRLRALLNAQGARDAADASDSGDTA